MEPPVRKFTMAHSATVAELPVLAAYDAEALEKVATASSSTAGVRVGGWRVQSVHGSIYGDAEVEALSARLASIAGKDGSSGLSLPEMPYTSSLTLTHEASGVSLRFAAEPALETWAATPPEAQDAATAMKVAPSKGWSNAGGPAASASATKTIGEVAAADEDGPDWTFFTEWAGNVGIGAAAAGSGDGGGDVEDASASKGGDGGGGGGGSSGDTLLPPVWMENQPVSGVDMVALSDQSVPILFYDDVALYEDELHDFGDMSLAVKFRAMPSCWFALLRCWVRVDSVGMKAMEHRFFCRYSETGSLGGPVVHCSTTERFSPWAALPSLGLSINPRDHLDPNRTIPKLPPSPSPGRGTPRHAKLEIPQGEAGAGVGDASRGGGVSSSSTSSSQVGQESQSPSSALGINATTAATGTNAGGSGGAYVPEMAARKWVAPRRAILAPSDMSAWQSSATYAELLRFVKMLGQASSGVPCRYLPRPAPLAPSPSESTMAPGATSSAVQGLVAILDQLEIMIGEAPPVQQPMRFGNRAFAAWHQLLVDRSPALISALPPPPAAAAAKDGAVTWQKALGNAEVELASYLCDSFGDPTRIDYGTGHETSFVALLYGLAKCGIVSPTDASDLVTVVFHRYMGVMRALQHTYKMEPAGSHGVWGLDDYHCLPFLWGAAQLLPPSSSSSLSSAHGGGSSTTAAAVSGASASATASTSSSSSSSSFPPQALATPACVNDSAVLEKYAHVSLYVAGIADVRRVKTGAPFSETSPMLHSISQLPTWHKVHAGLLKLYEAEVLGKFPVIQHFKFGSLLPATWASSSSSASSSSTSSSALSTSSSAAATSLNSSGPMESTRAPWATAAAVPASSLPTTTAAPSTATASALPPPAPPTAAAAEATDESRDTTNVGGPGNFTSL